MKREAVTLRNKAEEEIEALIASKKREAATISSAAKSEAEKLVTEATKSIADYRHWLISAVAESERLYKIQTQSLSAAQQAIEQSRSRLAHAFEKLSSLTQVVNESLDENNIPLATEFARTDADSTLNEKSAAKTSTVKKAAATKSTTKKSAAKSSTNKKSAAKRTPAKRAVVKKSARK